MRTYVFLTAWSPPAPAIEVLAGSYPEVVFELAAHDESMGWGLVVTWSDGHMVHEG